MTTPKMTSVSCPIEIPPLFHHNIRTSAEHNKGVHEILASASFLRHSSAGVASVIGDDGGDVIASIVSRSHVDDSGYSNSSRSAIVRRMDGSLVASFDLPPASPASHQDIRIHPEGSCDDKYKHDGDDKIQHDKVDDFNYDGTQWRTYQDPILCWASFRANNHRFDDFDDNSSGQNNETEAYSRNMLCILANPTTLMIFDALGENECTFQDDGDVRTSNKMGEGGGPAGHTIPLPFRARAIYSAGKGLGLLISRVDVPEDYYVGDGDMNEFDDVLSDDYNFLGDDGSGGGGFENAENELETSKVPGRGVNEDDDDDVGGGSEDFPLQDPPSPVRLASPTTTAADVNKRNMLHVDTGGWDAKARHAVNSTSHKMNAIYPMQNAIENMNNINALPCLFSLRHPLDEIRPLAIDSSLYSNNNKNEARTESRSQGRGEKVTIATNANHYFDARTTDMDKSLFVQPLPNQSLFSNVQERLVYVSTPRLFHTHSVHRHSCTNPICVTYNEYLQRHAVWTLVRAVPPVEELPLWKTTGRGAWRNYGVDDTEAAVGNGDINGSVENGREKEDEPSNNEESTLGWNDKYLKRVKELSRETDESRQSVGDGVNFGGEEGGMGRGPSIAEYEHDYEHGVGAEAGPPVRSLFQQPHDPFLDIQMQQQKLAQVGMARAPSSFSDIHPDYCLKLLFVEEQDNENIDDDPVKDVHFSFASKRQVFQRQMFLATDMHGQGDLVLSIFMPNRRAVSEENLPLEPAIIRCFNLNLPIDISSAKGRVNIESVIRSVDLPCSSAQPIMSIPAPLALFSCDGKGTSTSRFQTSDVNMMAYDILVVQRSFDDTGKDDNTREDTRSPNLSLYRAGTIHVADFCLPKGVYSGEHYEIFDLKNAVGDRVDIVSSICKSPPFEESSCVTSDLVLRASFSLVMHSSPISETSLRAIESSLVGRTDTVSASADSFLNRKDARIQLFPSTLIGLILPLLLRSDCAMMTQQMWVDVSGQDHRNVSRSTVDDHCWCALVSILLRLLLGPLNVCHDEPTKSNDSIQDCQRKVVSSPRSAWEELLQSEFHLSFMQGEGQMLFGETKLEELQSEREQRSGSDTIDSRRRFLRSPKIVQILSPSSKDETYIIDTINRSRKLIFDTLHLLHEDCRLAQQSRGLLWTRCLGSLLLRISEHMSPSMVDFEDHYQLHLDGYRCSFEEIPFVSNFEAKSQRLSNFTIPPCIMTCLDNFLQLGNGDFSSDDFICGITAYDEVAKIGLNGACSYSWMMLRLFKCLFDKDNIMSNITHPEEDEKSAECLDGDSESLQRKRDREGVLALLEEGIYHPIKLQDELPTGAFLPIFEAVCRCRQDPPQIVTSINSWSPAAYDLIGRNDLAELLSLRLLPIEQRPNPTSSSSGYSKIDELITSTDDDKDGLLALEEFSATIFPDDNRVREAARLLRSSRPIFLRVPRPVELSDHDYERKKQEKLSVLCHRSISLCLGRGMLTMGTHHALSAEQLVIPEIVLAGRVPPTNGTLALDTSSYPPNFRVWPEFHNGVAAGLRLSSAMGAKNHERTITRTWIKYNKPVTPQQSDNAAGSNSSSQIPPNYAHGGFLMALGLRGHLSVLTATDLTDYLTQGTITTTVGIFLGMAANKRGSCDPATSKMLCLHIPSLLPSSFIPMELASTVQASAVAGIGLLYQGSSHRLMTEFLLNEIGKHPIKDQSNNDREGFSLLCGLSLGMVNLQKGTSAVCGLEDLRIEERLHKYISGGIEINDNRRQKGVTNAAISAIHESERNSRVFEANAINRDITAPGATVALGLIYIKSHNKSVAMSLGLPDTHFQLDYVRPDLLALRVISRSLIFWNEIEPTPEWIDSIVPKVVTSSMEFMKNAARRAASFGQMDEHDQNSPEIYSGQGDATDFDPQAVRQAKSFIVAGACFSLGLRYAGTANRAAGSAIFERIIWFLELRDNKDIVTLTQRPDTCTLTTCLCTAAISLAMVMAGTGDLDSFRLFRAIRWRCDENTLYGTHMTLGAAIGLLFLGGGKYTLGNSPDDIAMLITSFYPHYPVLSSDNQYHLQALRHLYALAVHKRILEAVDVDSAEKVCIPIELSLAKSNESIEVTTPYLLANDSDFTEIRLKSDRYYPVVINLADFNVQGNLSTLYVKRKSGHLDHLQDPNALSSLSTIVESIGGEAFLKSIKFFSNDTILSSFAKYFCNPQYKIDDASFEADVTFEKLCNDIVNECMNDEKTAILPLYLKLFRFIDGISKKKNLNIQNIWDARLLRSYVEMKGRMDDSYFGLVNLLSREFIALVCESIEKSFRELGVDESALIKFFNDDGMKRTEGTTPRRIVESFLVWCQ